MVDDSWIKPFLDAEFLVGSLTPPLTKTQAWLATSLTHEAPPATIRAFAERYAHDEMGVWRALAESAASAQPDNRDALTDGMALAPLRALIERVNRVAVLYDSRHRWKTPNRWGYAFETRPPATTGEAQLLILRPPATESDLQRVESVIQMTLPPSYRRFLLVSNGLGVGARELTYICGAGPQRAHWESVRRNLWMNFADSRELAAQWRHFQGLYAYERIMDRDRGEDTFLSDETALVPFAHTYEVWCFDRTRPDARGEYPIVLWDHEMRQATDRYADFDSWFGGEVEEYIWPH